MFDNIQYMDTIFYKPEIIILDGKYGSGYIYSSTNGNIMKPIHIDFYSMREWVEEGYVKLISTNYNQYLVIPKTIPWRLITEWCRCGAHTSYWNN